MKRGPAALARLHKHLLEFYRGHARDLPWRRTRDPYRIWLSEIMLQQTRVETVLPYYAKFLARYPRVEDLAKAGIDEVRSLWAGLGYYSRAVNLHRAAQKVAHEFGGKFPELAADLRTLPGVGPYTAAAIASIAFGEDVAAVDGNLERVLARVIALRKPAKGAGEIREFAAKLAALGDAGSVNQALMDVSAAICLPRAPKCMICPIAADCEARRLGLTEEIPVKAAKRETIDLLARAVLVFRKASASAKDYEILLARRPAGAWLSGMWDLPWWLPDRDAEPELPPLKHEGRVQVKRTITHHRIKFDVRFGEMKATEANASSIRKSLRAAGSDFQWVAAKPENIDALPNPSRKAIRAGLEKIRPE